MKVRILNHNAYGVGDDLEYINWFPAGSVHEVYEFFPDTGEVNLGDGDEEITFAPSEYELVGE